MIGPQLLSVPFFLFRVMEVFYSANLKSPHKQDYELQISFPWSLGEWLLQCWVLSCFSPVPFRKDPSPSTLTPTCPSAQSPFPFASFTPRMRLKCHFAALQSLSVLLCSPVPLRDPCFQWCCTWTWDIITDGSRTLVITTFLTWKCQPLVLSQASQTCLESKWCSFLAS